MSSQTVDNFFMGGGAPTAKFPTIGTKIIGEILETELTQQREFNPNGGGELLYWKDGRPMMQAVITLQTDDRDMEIEDDNGQRRWFVDTKAKREAVKQALQEAGVRTLQRGGKLAVQYTADEDTGKGNPRKLYKAQYKPPTPQAVTASDLLDDQEPF